MMDDHRDFETITKNLVDGKFWYTIACSRTVCEWLRTAFGEQEYARWVQTVYVKRFMNYNVVDVDEGIYTMLALRWS